MPSMTAAELRSAFLGFFESRGHVIVPSSSLIPLDPTLLLTTAGMVQFKPYMLGDEEAPYARATSVQKCFRTTDIDIIGTTTRHLTFFEMLGNFSLGDYFKSGAIPLAWELCTEVFGFDPERLWVTVFETDDEAADIWREAVGVPPERIQRLGEEDNFWAMGPTGPCGPCSEIYFDRGPDFGAEGGPAFGGDERYIEVWNLVFMQYNRQPDGQLIELPRKNIDTGAGLERLLAVINDQPTVFETDVLGDILSAVQDATGLRYQDPAKPNESVDTSLRILADHSRAMTMLVNDGVVPSNEGRGYVLRRIIRRAVRHAYLLGVERDITGPLVDAAIAKMRSAYPDLEKNEALVRQIIAREEQRFRRTLARGLNLLDEVVAAGDVSGADAFFLHDTLGFPIDLTREIAEERGRRTDLDGFDALMDEQRRQAQQAHAAKGKATVSADVYRGILDAEGPTEFIGYGHSEGDGLVVAVVETGQSIDSAGAGAEVEVFLDRTPFYAESGGQIGDTGALSWDGGAATVSNTVYALPGSLVAHHLRVDSGTLRVGQTVRAAIDIERRAAIRKNHTGTHLLHWALRQVLGAHVKQAGSLVAPDRLRFDFSHHEATTAEELAEVEALANREVLSAAAVETIEASKREAEAMGAVAFFGDKYGERVRVLRAGAHSLEFCGGTHVQNLGEIGPIRIVKEESIGSNIRRIEAVTGDAALADIRERNRLLDTLARLLGVASTEVVDRVVKLLDDAKAQSKELQQLRSAQLAQTARGWATEASDGLLVRRCDGQSNDELRTLAVAARDAMGHGVAIVAGVTALGDKAGIAVAVSKELQDRGVSAGAIVAGAAKSLGGGAARNVDVVVGGGGNVGAIDEALAAAQAQAVESMATAGVQA